MMARQTMAARTVERAALRRGPGWKALDLALLLLLVVAGLLAVLAPGVLADVGDTALGRSEYDPALGASPSSLLLVVGRWIVALQVLYLLWHVREAPVAQRLAWTGVGVGLLMNYARNYYTGNPATVSFVLLQICLGYLIWRLTMRPTVWQQVQAEKARADAAEAALKRLKGEG